MMQAIKITVRLPARKVDFEQARISACLSQLLLERLIGLAQHAATADCWMIQVPLSAVRAVLAVYACPVVLARTAVYSASVHVRAHTIYRRRSESPWPGQGRDEGRCSVLGGVLAGLPAGQPLAR
jgi:hypothetical protein